MAEYEKFLPDGVPSWQLPYWNSLREHDVRVQRCTDCGVFRHVPKEICNRCYSSAAEWSPIAGTGEVYTYTVVRRAPTPVYQAEAPYVLVHITMNEDFRMIGSLDVADPAGVYIGQPVRIAYEDATPEWSILRFEPV